MSMENISVYEDEIDVYIDEYIQSRGIEDDKKISSSMWAACLMFVHAHVFKNDKDALKIKGAAGNAYDLDKVDALVDKYVYLCSNFNQRISLDHFSLLSGITRATMSYWTNSARRTKDDKARQIIAKLMDYSMMAADDLLLTKSGVNSIAYRNATETRYNNYLLKKDAKKTINTADLAERLGITEQLALPDKQPEPEPLARVKHPYDDCDFDMMDF